MEIQLLQYKETSMRINIFKDDLIKLIVEKDIHINQAYEILKIDSSVLKVSPVREFSLIHVEWNTDKLKALSEEQLNSIYECTNKELIDYSVPGQLLCIRRFNPHERVTGFEATIMAYTITPDNLDNPRIIILSDDGDNYYGGQVLKTEDLVSKEPYMDSPPYIAEKTNTIFRLDNRSYNKYIYNNIKPLSKQLGGVALQQRKHLTQSVSGDSLERMESKLKKHLPSLEKHPIKKEMLQEGYIPTNMPEDSTDNPTQAYNVSPIEQTVVEQKPKLSPTQFETFLKDDHPIFTDKAVMDLFEESVEKIIKTNYDGKYTTSVVTKRDYKSKKQMQDFMNFFGKKHIKVNRAEDPRTYEYIFYWD